MAIRIPTSDRSRLDTLDKVLLLSAQANPNQVPNSNDAGPVAEQTTAFPAVSLPADLTEKVQQCRSEIYGFVHGSKTIQQQLKQDREMRDDLLSKVRSGLSSYWKALTLYVETHRKLENPMAFYGLVDAAISQFSTLQVLRTGEQILRATESAEEAGLPVITLGLAHASFVEDVIQLGYVFARLTQTANDKTHRKQARNVARESCDDVLRRVAAYLRFSYVGHDRVDIRETMRVYGFRVDTPNRSKIADATDEPSTQPTDANQTQAQAVQTAVE